MFGEKWDFRFLQMARLVSTWSKDPSTQTGAVIVSPEKRVISVGFNGFPSAMPDERAHYANREEKYSRIVHCEMNALILAPGRIPWNSVLYTYPFMSCDRCAVHMIQAGIHNYVYPALTPEHEARWGAAMTKTHQYFTECGCRCTEYALDLL